MSGGHQAPNGAGTHDNRRILVERLELGSRGLDEPLDLLDVAAEDGTDGETLYSYRNLGVVSEVFKDKEILYNLVGSSAIGHVRYATAGDNSVRNVLY